MKKIIQISVCAGLLAGIGGVAAQPAAEPRRVEIHIAAQPMSEALQKLAAQAGVRVVFFPQAVKGLNAPEVSGRLTAHEAFKRLLDQSKLTWKFMDDKTVEVRLAGEAAGAGAPADQMRLAGGDVRAAPAQSPAGAVQDEMDRSHVTVRGERGKPTPFSTASIDLTRDEDDPLPFTVFSAREIELSGAATVDEFLRNRLPQNVSATIPEESTGTTSTVNGAFAQLDFRGWGNTETVILLNGRQFPARFVSGGRTPDNLGDIRGIPLGWIERIEVLSSAGSAIYGTGATGGVINIITRRDVRGGSLSLNLSNPARGSAPRGALDFSYALPLARDTTARIAGGYREDSSLRVRDRAAVMAERWRRTVLERNPGQLQSRTGLPLGATTNIRTSSTAASANLFGPGTANFTSVPAGYAGGAGITPFLSRQGVYELGLAEGSNNNQVGLAAPFGTRENSRSLSLGVDRALADSWLVSLDYRYQSTLNEGEGNYSATSTVFVPATAAFNPFGRDVRVNFDDPRLNRPDLERWQRNTTHAAVLSIRGGHRWRSLFDFSYSEDRNSGLFDRFLPYGYFNWPTSSSTLFDTLYNPFVDMRSTAPAAARFYERYTRDRRDTGTATNNMQASVKVSGPLAMWGGRSGTVTGGLEWVRQDRFMARNRSLLLDSQTGEEMFASSDLAGVASIQNIETLSAYAESTLTLIERAHDVPLVRDLEFFLSGRLSHQRRDGFRSDGMSFEYTTEPYLYALGLRHELIAGLALRVSRSIGFRPPDVSQSAPPDPPTTPSGVQDPRWNDQPLTLQPEQYIRGGNPDLDPETTQSTNIGLMLTPARLPGMRLSVDYVESTRNDAITSISLQEMLRLEAEFPGRVTRLPAQPGDPNGVGAIAFVDARNINLQQIASKSMDLSFEYARTTASGARLSFHAMATRQLSFKVQTTNTTAPVEQIRNPAATFSRQIEWNGNAQLNWQRDGWAMSWSTRYFDDLLVAPANRLVQGGDRVKWALEHDATVNYQADAGSWLPAGSSVSIGVRNVFDRRPRFWAAATDRGVVSYDSIVGRSLWLQVRQAF